MKHTPTPRTYHPLDWFVSALHRQTAIVLVVLTLSSAGILLWYVHRLEVNLVRSVTLEYAEFQIRALAEFRALYTSEVVENVNGHGIEITHDYKKQEGAIPLPATLTILLGNRIAEGTAGGRTRLFSAYPFPWRRDSGGLRSDLDREAWKYLNENTSDAFYRFEVSDGRPVLRYAVADRMRPACIGCHNSHPDSPKTNWKTGDVRGLLEIVVPMDGVIAITRNNLRGTLILVGMLSVIALLVVWLVIVKLRRNSRELEARSQELATFNVMLDKKVAERTEELTRSETQFRGVVESVPNGIVMVNEVGEIILVNMQTERLFGYERQELLGQSVELLVPGRFRSQHTEHRARVHATRQSRIMGKSGLTGRRKDGTEFLIEVGLSFIETDDGPLALATILDVTDRVQAEGALLQSEGRFRDLIEGSIQGIVIHREWMPLFVNQAYVDIFGYDSAEEILALESRECQIAPHERARLRNYNTERHRGGSAPSRYEYDAMRKDGSIITLENVVRPVIWEGEPATQNVVIDITQQRKSQKEIQSLSRRNALILNSIGEGIYGLDLEGRATFVNPATTAMLGWQAEELIGKEPHALLHHTKADGSPYPRDECPIYAAFTDGSVHHIDSEVFWRKDGTSFPVDYVSTPVRENGEVVGAVVTFRDITERRELEGQLQQAQKLESIGQLAAGIAHEINTPTQFVGDNTRFLKEAFDDLAGVIDKSLALINAAEAGPVPEALIEKAKAAMADADLGYLNVEIPNAITQSLEGIERVAKIVRAMKDFSHPGAEKKPVDLSRAIETTITVAKNEWKYVAEMVTDFDPDLPVVPCFAGEFNQVILNLITNAAHAIADARAEDAERKGTITVSTHRVDDFAEIRIRDTGTGIPEEIRNRVFDQFFTTKEVGKGTGQGLSIAHRVVVKKHGGEINLESEAGQGTTFIIRLPLTEPDLPSEVAA